MFDGYIWSTHASVPLPSGKIREVQPLQGLAASGGFVTVA
jgi:hypothetical protein